jgi:nicotinamide-nucleotide amidase
MVEVGGKLVVLLPGPPPEMQPMFEAGVLPALRARGSGRVLRTVIFRIAGMGESDVEQIVAPIYTTFSNPRTTILGGPANTELHFTAEAATPGEALALIEEMAGRIRTALEGRVYSEDGRELHEVVGALLADRELTVAVAESCTGGLLSARLTSIPGSSAYFRRGYVVYANEAKVEDLGVDPALVAAQGAVSAEVAAAMAAGARRRAGADIGVGITGIAGPGGGTPEKPVGLVFLAIDAPSAARVRRLHLPGDRDRVRLQATQHALESLRRELLGLPPP